MKRWPFRALVSVAFVVLLVGMGVSQAGAQAKSRHDLDQRFGVRGTTAAGFIDSYTGYILGRERTTAETRLDAKVVTDAQFHEFLSVLGFGPAVLLDAHGRAIDVAPRKAALIGTDIGSRYAHLTSALRGHPAVSNVVPSAAQSVPIVAFATPFTTKYGMRVVSGAYDLESKPMGIYLHHVLPYSDGTAYLVDASGTVIAASTNKTGPLAGIDDELTKALNGHSSGAYRPDSGGARRYATATVGGTPWRLVITVPEHTLLHPISEADRMLPWIFLAAFALAGGALLLIFVRSREGRAHARIDARTDALTGIANRRATEESLHRLVADHKRHGVELGVLIIDIDHFKLVNDHLGHGGGDIVLCEVITRLSSCLRVNDQVGRWGGEEFVVLLPHTDAIGVALVAERIRLRVAEGPIGVKHASVAVTVSIGGAMTGTDDDIYTVVGRADDALYTAKETGRNRSITAADDTKVPVTT
jgi:diguanylate cyclase (GGDEF)-like protein